MDKQFFATMRHLFLATHSKKSGCETAFSKFREIRNFNETVLNFAKFRENKIVDFHKTLHKFHEIFAKVMKYFRKKP